jgi:hypothetical protein
LSQYTGLESQALAAVCTPLQPIKEGSMRKEGSSGK